MSVLTLAGKPINWAKPPKATDKVMWSQRTTGGKKVIGSLRTIAHLDNLNTLAKKQFKTGISVMQGPYNTGVKASAGTHDYDACLDVKIVGVAFLAQQSFFRSNGAGAYYRTPAQGFTPHIHYFTLPPREGVDVADDYKMAGFKVGKYVDGGWSTSGRKFTSAQISDYYGHRTALSGHAHDPTWFPPNIAATIFNLPAYIARQRGDVPPVAAKPSAPATATPKGHLRVDGVDTSHWQSGVLNAAAAKKVGVKWWAHKVTEGLTVTDAFYARRRAEAKAAGLPFGGYHFARPTKAKGDATKQAAFFLAHAKPVPGDMRPTLDIEVMGQLSMGQVRTWTVEFSNAIFKALKVRPIIYTKSDWNFGSMEDTHTIWRARYNPDNRRPARRWDIHQFSGGAETPGTPSTIAGFGRVDLNNMRDGLTVAALLIPVKDAVIPKPPVVPPVAPVKPPVKPPVSGNAPVMVWKGKVMPVDGPIMQIPPAQRHWLPAVGDRIEGAWETCVANTALDGNVTPGANSTAWFLHWGIPGKDGYLWIVKNGKTVKMTPTELKRPLNKWTKAQVKTWRDKHGQAPMTLDEGLAWLVKHHVYGALEVKGPAWGSNPNWFKILYAACKRQGHPAVVKRLTNLALPKQTVDNAHKAGVQIAAIYGFAVKGRAKRTARTKVLAKKGIKFDATW